MYVISNEPRRSSAEFAVHYARAMELRCEKMAEEILEISDDNYTGPDGRGDNALVQQARLRVDSRRWLLSKLMPKKYGDRITQEIARRRRCAVDHPHRAGRGLSAGAAGGIAGAGQ